MAQENSEVILKKLSSIQKDVEPLAKEGRNLSQGYDYLAEAQITALFKPLLQAHGVVFTFSSLITGVQATASGKQLLTSVRINYRFSDIVTGDFVKGDIDGQGCDPNDKGVYKAITGAIKYLFMKTFMLPTGDDPENEDTPPAQRQKGDKPPFGKGAEKDED